jgi:serine protease inhibitor
MTIWSFGAASTVLPVVKVTMRRISVERRLLLKAAFGAAFGLINGASLADILQGGGGLDSGQSDAKAADDLLSAQSRLSENLIRYLVDHAKEAAYAGDGANLIVSPASLAAILSFVDLGANTPMRSAIHRTLGFMPAARRRTEQELAALRNAVAAISARATAEGTLALANLLAFDLSTRPRQLALTGLSAAGADVLVDHLGDPKIIGRINDWVRQKTHDLIPSIIEEAPADMGLVAVNALYFKDRWKTPFDPARTMAEPFQTASGRPVSVKMMHSPVAKFGFRQDQRFIATELGYANDDFKLVVITTKSWPAQLSEFSAVADWLSGRGFELKNGEIGLPKLSLSAAEELLRPLDALGLRPARQMPDALDGFSGMSLVVTRVVQKLELRLSEEGTEAAAATAVVTTRSLAAHDHVKLVVDKPFMFALRDQKSGLVLFTGFVSAPAETARTSFQQ